MKIGSLIGSLWAMGSKEAPPGDMEIKYESGKSMVRRLVLWNERMMRPKAKRMKEEFKKTPQKRV
jgi:hypothetical protein